jgi:hypothetical protein
VRDDPFEESLVGPMRLAGVQSHLHRARRFDFDDAESFHRTEDRRETESTATFDDDSA